jgi:phage baseplate assembly protein gpV
MDARCEEGVILGCIHSNPEPADTAATTDTFRQVYADSALFSYDKGQHKFNMQGQDGIKLSDIISNIIAAVQQITVIYGNNPDYSKLTQAQTYLQNLLE